MFELKRVRAAAALLCALLVSPLAAAQDDRRVSPGSATLHGTITTENGAVRLPGAVVTVIDPRTSATVTEVTSDETGRYQVSDLKPGYYNVRASLDGFTPALKAPVQLAAGKDTDV